MNNISLYLPSTIYGGTEILMTRLADFLAAHNNNVTIYIKQNSSILQHYTPSINVILSFDIEKIKDTTLIISSKYIIELSSILQNTNHISMLIWQLQPIELISQFFPARRFDKKTPVYDKIIDLLYLSRRRKLALLLSEYHKSNSLFFMDIENYNKTNDYLNLNFESPCFIPVAIPFKEIKQNNSITLHVENFCVVSRISFDFKFHAIKNFITSLNEYSKKHHKEIKVHIVGDGDALVELKKYTMQLSITCIFYGFMPPDKVRSDIFPIIDIYFGMGTSLIDSSMYRIPSIITNISDRHVKYDNIKYSLLYEANGYNLGSYSNEGMHTFDHLIETIEQSPSYHGEKCYHYAKKNHDSNISFNKIKLAVEKKNEIDTHNLTLSYLTKKHLFDMAFKFMLKTYKLAIALVKEKK